MKIPKTLRWRLPFSYAAIALLATLTLGAVLLAILQGFYRQQETLYLSGNASAIGDQIAYAIKDENLAEVLQPQAEGFAFLSQARVQILDLAREEVLADSGDPRLTDGSTNIKLEVEVGDVAQSLSQSVNVADEQTETTYRSSIVIKEGLFSRDIDETLVVDGSEPYLDDRLSTLGPLYGFGLLPTGAANANSSNLIVDQAIFDETGTPLGYVRLSEGPAYGRSIVRSVAWGWAIASAIAVLLAAIIGWVVSRRISEPLVSLTEVTTRMTDGDLTARAAVVRQDEIGTLGRSFNEMAERVEETVFTLRRFVADAAHELHTPLTALRTNLELIAGDENAQQDARLSRAQEQVSRLEALTVALLDLSRIEAETAVAPQHPFDLNQLVAMTSEIYASQAEQKGVDFTLDLPVDSLMIQGEPDQFAQSLTNILDNSIKFTPAGGQVEVVMQKNDSWAEIVVSDSGIGIPISDRPHLFSRFHRGRNAAAYPGSGLGLAIAKAIVEKHKGSIVVEHKPIGTVFLLRLPISA